MRREVDGAIEAYFAATRSVQLAGKVYFSPIPPSPEARRQWQLAMERAARAAERLREVEVRVADDPEARGYLKGRLVAPQVQ